MGTSGPLTTGTLDHEAHQGLHGESLVRSLVAAAGLEIMGPTPAYGKDIYIGFPGPKATLKSPRILVSIKSWRGAVPNGDDNWEYPHKITNFNYLARMAQVDPASRPHLFVVTTPTQTDQYSMATHQHLLLRQAAYWYSFEHETPDLEASDGSKKKVTIPRRQLLTVETLTALVEGREADATVTT